MTSTHNVPADRPNNLAERGCLRRLVRRRGRIRFEGRWVTPQWYHRYAHAGRQEMEAVRRVAVRPIAEDTPETERTWSRVAVLEWLAALGDAELADVWNYANDTHNRRHHRTPNTKPSNSGQESTK